MNVIFERPGYDRVEWAIPIEDFSAATYLELIRPRLDGIAFVKQEDGSDAAVNSIIGGIANTGLNAIGIDIDVTPFLQEDYRQTVMRIEQSGCEDVQCSFFFTESESDQFMDEMSRYHGTTVRFEDLNAIIGLILSRNQ